MSTEETKQNANQNDTNEVNSNEVNITETKLDLGNYEEDMKKYTKIDNLDEDSVVESGKFFLVSFISPEGVMNCKTRGLKIRTHKNRVVFATLEEAKAAAEEINQKDKYFHVFVGETGKWMGWDPSPDDRNLVAEEKWADKDQNELMQEMRNREENKLKELNALVGKKKDMQNKEKKNHKKRVANALKESAANVKASKEANRNATQETAQETAQETTQETTQEHQSSNTDNLKPQTMTEEEVLEEQNNVVRTAKKNHDPRLVKERLKQKLREKNKTQDPMKKLSETTVKDMVKQELDQTGETKSKIDENIKKLSDILQKAKQTEASQKQKNTQ
jgi:hypothetical protein